MYRLMPFSRRALMAAAALSSLCIAPRLTLAQAGCAAGETSIRAGDARLASLGAVPADSIEMSVTREGATRPFGTYAQHIERTTVNGTPALLLVQRGTSPRGVAIDSVWVDARSWAPLRHWANTPGNRFDVTYRGRRVTGELMRGDTAKTIDRELPANALDYSTTSTALRAIPLCEGVVIRAGGYDPSRDTIVETVHRVAGAERVEIGGAPRDVWLVDVTVMDRTVRLHIDRATGRELAWAVAGPGGATLRGESRIFTGR